MNGAHLASQIRGGLGYAHRPQLGSQINCPIGNQIWGPLGKEDVCPNFVLTVTKFVLSNSGNFRTKANPPKPRSCPKRPFGQWLGSHSSADWIGLRHCLQRSTSTVKSNRVYTCKFFQYSYIIHTNIRNITEVGRCSRRSGGQSWLEETHCPICCPAREGLRSKVNTCRPYISI